MRGNPQVFLSHAREDTFEATLLQRAIEQSLEDLNVHVWRYGRDQLPAIHSIPDSLRHQIDESGAIIFLVSPFSNANQWTELGGAHEKRIPIFVLLHHLTHKDLARKLDAPKLILDGPCTPASDWELVLPNLRKACSKEGHGDGVRPPSPGSVLRRYAYPCLKSCPLPVAIKDRAEHVLWCNHAYASLLRHHRSEILGKTVRQLLGDAITTVGPDSEVTQWLTVDGVEIDVIARRCTFRNPENPSIDYIGDVSFPIKNIEEAKERGFSPLECAPDDPEGERISERLDLRKAAAAFLQALPSVAVLKDPGRRVGWANAAYVELASTVGKNSLSDVVGRTAAEVFGARRDTAVDDHEDKVVRGQCLLGSDSLLGRPRISVRFPIFDADQRLASIGVISVNEADLVRSGRHSAR